MKTEEELEALINPETEEWIKKNSAIMHEYTRRIWAHEPTKDLEAILFGETNQP
jgi:hypothetical protein